MVVLMMVLGFAGCKSWINPSIPPEGDADLLVAQAEAEMRRVVRPIQAPTAGIRQITLTVNNAPGMDRPLEMEAMQRVVDLFERRNPGIRIQFSPWRFTPESFFERLANRTLTDVVEVDVAQIPTILDVNGAADLTENVAAHPEVQLLNPASLSLSVRDGRFFGIPGELHTLALFYNRRLLAASQPSARPGSQDRQTTTPAASNRRRSRGSSEEDPDAVELRADGQPLRTLFEEAALGRGMESLEAHRQPRLLAQAETRRTRRTRGQQEVQETFQVQTAPTNQGQANRRRGFFRNWFRATRDEPETTPPPQQPPRTAPRKTPVPPPMDPLPRDTVADDPGASDVLPSDPTDPVQVRMVDEPTPMIATSNLPQNWDQFVQLAIRLTNHREGIYGFAPVLFSRDGGREFTQWGVQAGLRIMSGTRAEDITLDVNSATAAAVVQFLKDLRWRHDVMPPPEQCFRDNLMRLFANGRLAMMILPTDQATINQLLRLGMPMEDLGIAPLPAGPRNRKHLAMGTYYIINSQIDAERRAAAFRWLLFLSDPETLMIRQQFLHQEGELTGAPGVSRYTTSRQVPVRESLRRAMRVPVFLDYDALMTDSAQLALEPPHFTDRFFEALAEDVRPMIERNESDPSRDIARVGAAFVRRHLREPDGPSGAAAYLQTLQGLLNRPGFLTPRTIPGLQNPE
jgi:ABC-type glycerol-3-phosphate transport system substrate-binding protein